MNDRSWTKNYDKGVPATIDYPQVPLQFFLEDSARKYPGVPCTIFKGAEISYKEMNEIPDRVAAALASLGVKKGDRVGIYMPNTPDGIPLTDVTSIGTELSNHYGFNVIPLVDKPSDSIYESIIRLSRILKPNDQLLMYVAGHGDYDEQLFDDGFIVCANSKQAKDDPYRNSYIQYSKLSRMINKLPASQVMMVLDGLFWRILRRKSGAVQQPERV